jgi:hypothetical protein
VETPLVDVKHACKIFTLKQIIALLRKKPYITEINKHLQKRYAEHIQKHPGVKLKKGYY